ncbi:MAG: cation:proton antiporter [Verrucomicrobiota bacterium]|nr:cation:proton antiporter [Verrucomicrobiota bacterium]MCC6819817.1 cation:proton antiporter [Limisphaerales bacterium]
MTLFAVFITLVFFYSLVSGPIERTIVTAPMVFTAAGIGCYWVMAEFQLQEGSQEIFLRLAEIGLVLLLFTDASRTDLQVLRNIRNLPVRLLSTGMLLTLLLGTFAALVVFRHLSLWEAGILAAILAPTDAGLGQVIVNSQLVPMKIRQALNVEAGLNDGLSVPFLLFFIALAGTGAETQSARLGQYILEQLGFGTLAGIGIGLIGGWLLGFAHRKKLVTESWTQLGVVAVPLLCLLTSQAVGASMFIAAFVAGLAVQVGFKPAGQHSVDFAEEWGQLINLSVFFLFGLFVGRNGQNFTVAHVVYAVLSLTVVRMLPVAAALVGTSLSRATVLFMGWFGPRGLASIVLALVYLEQGARHPGESTIRLAVMATVLLSIFAHGLSAAPGITLYAAKIAALHPEAPERQAPEPSRGEP